MSRQLLNLLFTQISILIVFKVFKRPQLAGTFIRSSTRFTVIHIESIFITNIINFMLNRQRSAYGTPTAHCTYKKQALINKNRPLKMFGLQLMQIIHLAISNESSHITSQIIITNVCPYTIIHSHSNRSGYYFTFLEYIF